MQGSKKLEARAWDPEWHCFDVDDDPHERKNLGMDACGDLKQLAVASFGGLPGNKKKQ
jgi:hypothetical protein